MSEKMRIAFFTETYLPNIDGVVISIIDFRKELKKRGHKIFIFAPEGKKENKKENRKSVRKNRNEDRNENRSADENVFYYKSIPFLPYPEYRLALAPIKALKTAKKKDIDVIHSHGMGPMGLIALYISKNLGIPVIGTLHTNIQEAIHYLIKTKRLQKKLKEIAWKYLRVYFNRCDKVIVPSEFMVKECRKNGIKNVVFVPNGINLKRFKPLGGGRKEKEKIRKKLKFDILSKNLSKNLSKKIIILFIGRLVREKNLDIVIGSASEIKAESKKTGRDIHFLIVGDGPAKEYYKNLTKKHGVEDIFTFIGRVERENIIDYFKSGDIFVFPSIFETQGIAGIEAMACGLPVAGAKYLAIPDLIKDGYNGYLFAPRNKKECISAVLKTIKERKKLSLGAIKTAKKYSIEKCTNELIDIYKEIIKH